MYMYTEWHVSVFFSVSLLPINHTYTYTASEHSFAKIAFANFYSELNSRSSFWITPNVCYTFERRDNDGMHPFYTSSGKINNYKCKIRTIKNIFPNIQTEKQMKCLKSTRRLTPDWSLTAYTHIAHTNRNTYFSRDSRHASDNVVTHCDHIDVARSFVRSRHIHNSQMLR